jgi:hypothetical protein
VGIEKNFHILNRLENFYILNRPLQKMPERIFHNTSLPTSDQQTHKKNNFTGMSSKKIARTQKFSHVPNKPL